MFFQPPADTFSATGGFHPIPGIVSAADGAAGPTEGGRDGGNLWQLQLIDGWRLRRGDRDLRVGLRQQRLIAALALLGPRPRPYLAGTLWPDSADTLASGNLREAVWTISRQLPALVSRDNGRLELTEDVRVDVQELRGTISGPAAPGGRGRTQLLARGELLPGWYDDWVLHEQERWRFQRLAALEAMAEDMLTAGDVLGAMEAAHAALRIEPLHANAIRLILRAHLREGNHAGALGAYRGFSSRMRTEFGAALPADVTGLIRPLLLKSG